jgi:hypothetical protein
MVFVTSAVALTENPMGVLGFGDLKESLWSVWVLRSKESGGLRRTGGLKRTGEEEYERGVDIEAIFVRK